MNILQEILKSGNGKIVGQIASQFGLDESDAAKALANLIPAVAGGIKKTANSTSGLEALVSKIEANRDVQQSFDSPEILTEAAATQSGNEILGDIFGSKEVSRTVAGQTAKSTGLDLGILKKMLPLVAGVVMSSLNKRGSQSSGGLGGLLGSLAGAAQPQPRRGGLGGLLGSLLGGGRQKAQQSTTIIRHRIAVRFRRRRQCGR